MDSWPHLGHVLNVNRDDGADMDKTRTVLCGQINNVLCYFGHVFPVLKLNLIKTFCYSLYGSVLWQLDHSKLEALCTMAHRVKTCLEPTISNSLQYFAHTL